MGERKEAPPLPQIEATLLPETDVQIQFVQRECNWLQALEGDIDTCHFGFLHGGSITAAQFLQRFVNDTPWAHLDIAGTAMGAPKTEINHSWASGYGVRLLERLVAEYYEAKK